MAKHSGFKRDAVIKKVALGHVRVPAHAQRALSESWVNEILAMFDPDKLKHPVLSERGDYFNIVDGQHGTEALKRWLGEGWEAQQIDCIVHSGLTDAEEADLFLSLNRSKQVTSFDKFEKAVTAGYPDEVHINAIVRGAGLRISRSPSSGGGVIRAVTTLRSIYKRADGNTLAKTLRVVRDSFGDQGFDALLIDGIGHLCQRYNGVLKEEDAVERLSSIRGGANGLLGKAEVLRKQTGNSKALCVAAAAVEIINTKRGKQRLASWWK